MLTARFTSDRFLIGDGTEAVALLMISAWKQKEAKEISGFLKNVLIL